MRVDKYLWCIRVFKTRSKAADACKKNRISIGNEVVKPSRGVKIDEVISVRKNQINYSYKVFDFPKSRVGAKLVENYSMNVTSKEELEKLEMQKFSKGYHREKGAGRPTKRERRDLDAYFE